MTTSDPSQTPSEPNEPSSQPPSTWSPTPPASPPSSSPPSPTSPPSSSSFPPPPADGPGGYPSSPPANYGPPSDGNSAQGYPAAPPPPTGPAAYGGVDPITGLSIPAGTELASIGRRIGAYFLAIPLFIVTLGIGYLIWGLILWPRGQTPALKVLNMRVWVPEQNKPPGFGRMALREIVGRIVEGILGGISQLASFITFIVTKKRQSFHDLIASTVVLYDPEKRLEP